jgi:hypothetical protein
MVSSVDGLAGAAAVGRQVPPRGRNIIINRQGFLIPQAMM